eukprot:COSAG06_NODE_6520_length_2897_cov_1.261973_2_plen_93_part_00
MKLTSLFNKIKNRDPTAMPCWKSLRMATIEGAAAIGTMCDDRRLGEGTRNIDACSKQRVQRTQSYTSLGYIYGAYVPRLADIKKERLVIVTC